MLQKCTYTYISDSTNGRWGQLFHLYGGFFRKYTNNGLVAKLSIKKIKAPINYYKGLRVKPLRKGQRRRGVISLTAQKRGCRELYLNLRILMSSLYIIRAICYNFLLLEPYIWWFQEKTGGV